MAEDIVDRLRHREVVSYASDGTEITRQHPLAEEAADEIQSLRSQLAEARTVTREDFDCAVLSMCVDKIRERCQCTGRAKLRDVCRKTGPGRDVRMTLYAAGLKIEGEDQ